MATIRTRIGPADDGRRITLGEFWGADEEPGYLFEVVQGVLEVSEIPADLHFQVVDNLHEAFSSHRRQHPGLIRRIGRGSDVRFIIPELETDRHPDLAVVFRATSRRDLKGRLAAMLGVEVVSLGARSRTRDYVDKRADYLAVGLLEYWIVDPDEKQVTVLSRRDVDGAPAWEERIYRGDEAIVSGLLPGFAGTVGALWAGMDEMG